MSPYQYTDLKGDSLTVPSGKRRIITKYKSGEIAGADLPTDPAELHKLTEAIHGRKIQYIAFKDDSLPDWMALEADSEPEVIAGRKVADVCYEDELPEVEDHVDENEVYVDGSWLHLGHRDAEAFRRDARKYLAVARHIEARDAAAKEQEREQVTALSDFLYNTASLALDVKQLTPLVKAGLRAPQGAA